MNPQKQEVTLYDAVTPVAVTSSTNATPIVVTATAHGLNTGDRVLIYGHTTNVAANGIFKVTWISSSTFSLQDEFTGADVAGVVGSGSGGVLVKAPPVLLVSDFRNIILQVGTSGTTTATLKIAGSLGKAASSYGQGPRYDYPNIGATVSPSNPYSFLQFINLDTADAVNGATGIAVTGTDINNLYVVNVTAMKYLTVIPISWTQGAVSIKALMNTAV